MKMLHQLNARRVLSNDAWKPSLRLKLIEMISEMCRKWYQQSVCKPVRDSNRCKHMKQNVQLVVYLQRLILPTVERIEEKASRRLIRRI
ncbi:hypothetical protein CANCADRAFT_99657 [Tortispora caseinolytica NRRL Y-17796]|uniref:Uncharacterized protein n=1 Tax=Tortispora caseinolytica NRRL Y-17796 TaxID=767744 RepID=A0A1E4TE42_9ASCO|nr:hypothetical protein CANCADRAFT_99657 [Tortispora caseinolytica NRRL Y-17796]